MDRISHYFFSTIGSKKVVGLAGLALAGFVLSHMAGNMLILVSPKDYNTYAHALITNPLIYLAEAGLIAFFLAHIILGIVLTVKNRMAKGTTYAVSAKGDKSASYASRTMVYQGIVIGVFLVYHLVTFKFGPYYEVTYDGVLMRDLHRLVIEVFQKPAYVVWYVFCVGVLGYHLSHGVYSSFQTLGFYHARYTPYIKCISVIYGILIGAGFMVQPLYVYLFD
ncbi:MAG: cytochrome B subunit [Bdellovibrionales bacterium CG10_big_fil_rev_8_21_14_0_10_45_34]|nr:MAG: cytochrome B subunit [Bdellovibrionales bacterium CG10_big_fil_rev_8_21_14_0_10_45_34]